MGSNVSLFRHPNFRISKPRKGESQIAYALRMASHLMSPPKLEGEHYSIRCEDAAKQIMELESHLVAKWEESQE